MTNVEISKNSTSVTIHSVEATENFDNKLIFIRPPQMSQNQSSGPKDTKAIDMLIITHTLVVRGHINKTASKTAKQVINDLKSIFKGAQTTGGPCTVVYDGDSLSMFPEKLTIIKKPLSEADTSDTSVIQYDVQLTLVEGVSI
jgi:hypothetical protein